MERLKDLYMKSFGRLPQTVVRLTGDGSNRVYYRLVDGEASFIGVVGTSVRSVRIITSKKLGNGNDFDFIIGADR